MKFNVIKLPGILLLVIAMVEFSEGQVPYFQHYTLLRKNEPVQVNTIFQDKTGFIWYGTNKGLFKFDGINLHRFTSADSLPDENVTALAVDSVGRIWTGYKNGSLAYIENNRIRIFNPDGLGKKEVSGILFDRKGNLWFSTLNDGLYYFTNGRLYRIDENEGMPDLFVYNIAEDKQGNIWAGTDGGVAVCNLQGTKVSIKIHNYRTGLPDNIIKKLIADADGSIWMGTEDAGIVNYNPQTGKYISLIPHGWHFGVVTDFLIDENEIWISSLQTGLFVYDRKTHQIKLYNAKSGPGLTSIKVLLRDQEGNIWAGSKSDIIRTQGDQVEFIDAFDPSKDVNAVAVAIDKQNNIWFCNREGLFKRIVDEAGKVSIEKPLAKSALQNYTVISLYVDAAGYIWAGLYGEGVVRINPKTGTTRYLNKELRNGNILNITGKGDVVWLATLGGGAKIKILGEQLSIRNYTSEDGLISDYIYQVFVDSQNRVWFATDGRGADMMDETGFHHYQEGLNSKVVYGFAEDQAHHIWINTQGDGLYRLDGEKFQLFDPQGKRLHDNNISCFTSTPSGNLFIVHDLGIDIYDVVKNKIHFLGEDVGIHDKKPYLNAVAKDDYGHIFIGSDEGIIKYSDLINHEFVTPTLTITGFNVMNQSIELTRDRIFKYDQNDITIEYQGMWFQNPAALHYQYRLMNYDREWISSRNHAVTYSSLPPGEYTFQLKVSEGEDFSGAAETSVVFTIRSPFWQQTWFYLLVIASSILLIYFFIKFRERRLRNDKQVLETSIEERTHEITKMNGEINKQADEIRGINENLERLVRERTSELEKKNEALAEYAFINAHQLRAPVASILGLIKLIESMDLEEEEKIYLKHLQTSAEKLDAVVRSIGKAIEKGGLE